MAERSPLMKPRPNRTGSVVSSERCACRGRSSCPGCSGTPTALRRREDAVALLVPAIVVSRTHPGDAGDGGLEMPKEPDRLERPVAPSRGDAVRGVIRTAMMDRVRGAAQQDAAVLKHADQPRRRAHVRPLMNLVRHHADSAERKAGDDG